MTKRFRPRVLPLSLALLVALVFARSDRADGTGTIEVTSQRAAAVKDVFRVVSEPSKDHPGLFRVVVSGRVGPGVRVAVHLTIGPAGKPRLWSPLVVAGQDQPDGGKDGKPTQSWYATFDADAETVRECRLMLYFSGAEDSPEGTEYEIPVRHFVGE